MSELNFLIKPCSHLCNLDCDYCFYKRVAGLYPDQGSIMSIETVEAFTRKALTLGASRNLFGWQGGEPTLAGLDFYKTVVKLQNRYSRPGQTVMNSLQTNGVLLDENWAEFLNKHGFLVGLSLDGPREVHDAYRRTYAGRGTYKTVMERVGLLRKHGVEFNIMTLLTTANIHQPDRLYAFFRRNGLDYLQFIPCLEWDPDTGARRPYSIDGTDLGKFYCRVFDLWLKDGFPYVSIRLFEDILIYLLDKVLLSCTWQPRCNSYLLVEHNGDCYPCDFFVYPEWKLGNIILDSLPSIINSPIRSNFAAMKSNPAAECSGCGHVNFCHGDCTKFRYNQPGRYDGLSHYCAAWKMLLGHIENHPKNVREMALKARQEFQKSQMKKPGRNDPCPCGSGKKYKKCCLGKT